MRNFNIRETISKLRVLRSHFRQLPLQLQHRLQQVHIFTARRVVQKYPLATRDVPVNLRLVRAHVRLPVTFFCGANGAGCFFFLRERDETFESEQEQRQHQE